MPWEVPSAHAELSAPALVCHLAFMKPLAASDLASKRRDHINQILKSIHEKANVPHTPLARDKRVSVVKMRWRSLPVTLVFFLSRELVSLSIYIHADGIIQPEENVSTDPQNRVAKAIIALQNISNIFSCESTPANLSEIHESLFENAWDKFFLENPEIPPPDPKWSGFADGLKDPKILVDWRGVIALKPPQASDTEIIDRICPFLGCSGNYLIDDFSICTMRGGNVLHVSSMFEPTSGTPFYMLLCDNEFDAADIGELLDTGNRTLVYRFAAVEHKAQIETAWRLSEVINIELDGVRRSLLDNSVSPEKLSKLIDDASMKFNKKVDHAFVGGIYSRLRNVEAYIYEFYQLSDWLGIKPIDTYRTYKERADKELSSVSYVVKRVTNECDSFRDEIIKLRSGVDITVAATEQNDIRHLQVVAELLACLIFVPYYFGHAVSETYHVWWGISKFDEGPYDRYIWSSAWVLGVLLTLWRTVKNPKIALWLAGAIVLASVWGFALIATPKL
jgi:hypothetical protein